MLYIYIITHYKHLQTPLIYTYFMHKSNVSSNIFCWLIPKLWNITVINVAKPVKPPFFAGCSPLSGEEIGVLAVLLRDPRSLEDSSTRDICQLPSSPWASKPRILPEMETNRCVDQQHGGWLRNPAPVENKWFIPWFIGVSTILLVVQDFFHPLYVKQHMTWNWHQLAINIHRHGWFKVSALWNKLVTSLIWYTSLHVAEMDENCTRMYYIDDM